MSTRSDPGGRTDGTSMTRRLYVAVCWSLLIATLAAAGFCVALLAGMVLQGIWPN